MSLSAVVAELVTHFAEEGIAAPVLFGKDYLSQHEAAGRVVVIPTRDSFEPPESPGGNPRRLATRRAGADLYVHGEDFAAAEALIHDTARGLLAVCGTSVQLEAAQWSDEIKTLEYGATAVLSISVAVPVTDVALATAPPDLKAAHTGRMVFERGGDGGEATVSGCASEGA